MFESAENVENWNYYWKYFEDQLKILAHVENIHKNIQNV